MYNFTTYLKAHPLTPSKNGTIQVSGQKDASDFQYFKTMATRLNDLGSQKLESLRTKLLSRITISTRGCWIFQGATRKGYGAMRISPDDPVVGAHQVSFVLHGGKIHQRLEISHRCHDKRCCNPEHLLQESRLVNVSRRACVAGTKCIHDPQCLL